MPKIPAHIDPTDDEALADWVQSDEFAAGAGDFVDAEPLRRVAAARDAAEQASDQVTAAVVAAREAGMSWTLIAAALGVSRQAARQRYVELARR